MATVAELAEKVATELGEPYGNPDVALQFERWVIEVTGELWDSEEWYFTLGSYTLEAENGVARYTLPADIGAVRLVVETSTGEPLDGTTRETLTRRCADLTDTGTPSAWFIDGIETDGRLVLRLWQVPSADQDYEVQYSKLAPALEDGEDAVPLPPDTHRAIMHGVRARYHENADEMDHSDRSQARYAAALGSLKKRYLSPLGLDRRIRFGDLNNSYAPHPVPRVPRSIG